jgi:hypothetical protein
MHVSSQCRWVLTAEKTLGWVVLMASSVNRHVTFEHCQSRAEWPT